MTGTIFVDSNILIYAHDLDAGAKRLRAAACLRELWDSGRGRMSATAAREVVRNYGCWVRSPTTPATVIRASEIAETWKLSFWDSMILAIAEQTAQRSCSRKISITDKSLRAS
jgi:predicted nucleic acid-binding protein